jgi:chromosome segregation ATPase
MGRRMDGSFGGNDRMRPAGMQPKQSQSNTAVPNKSYLVEDDDGDVDSVYNKRDTTTTSKSNAVSDKVVEEYKTQIEDLNRKMERLEGQLEDNDRFTQDKADELRSKDRQLQDKDDEIERLEERNRSSARNNDTVCLMRCIFNVC